jgi:kynurenine formamidase
MKSAIAVLGVVGAVALAGASGNAAAPIAKNVAHLPTSYAITAGDRQAALNRQATTLHPGDAVLVRTGVTAHWPDPAKYRLADQPGLSLEAAQWLVEGRKAMVVGAHNAGVESFPSKDPENDVPLHTYLQADQGVSLFEALWLEHLSKDQVYESLFIASALKLRGATASPLRPFGIPIQRNEPKVDLQA